MSRQERPDAFYSFDWHAVWFEKLDRAKKTGAPVAAWIHPTSAQDAVLDKHVRFEGLWFAVLMLAFGSVPLLFVGLVIFSVVLRRLCG